MENLRKELCFTVQHMCGELHRPLQTIYIGGGTPTALDEHWLQVLMDLVHEICGEANVSILRANAAPVADEAQRDDGTAEALAKPAAADMNEAPWMHTVTGMPGIVEFTVEAGRPDSITREKLEILKAAGVDRISVNPQTFCQKTLDLIGRKHSVEEVIEKYALARSLGFENINMDIILGLPGEKLPEVTHTLSEIGRLRPDSLTVHSLAIKRAARLNMFKEDYKDYKIINTQEHMDLVADCAAQMGLFPYYLYRQKGMAGNLENVGYAKEGMAGVYNVLIMEEKQTIVACGAGASTKRVWTEPNPDGTHRIERAENVKDVAQYIARIDEMIQRKQKLFAEE